MKVMYVLQHSITRGSTWWELTRIPPSVTEKWLLKNQSSQNTLCLWTTLSLGTNTHATMWWKHYASCWLVRLNSQVKGLFLRAILLHLLTLFSLAELAYQIGNMTLNSYPSLVFLNFAKLVKPKAFYHTALKQGCSNPQPGEACHQ